MQIQSYGLFWSWYEIDWHPGRGNKHKFELLGNIGERRPSIRVADFRKQTGIYILYNEYGPTYVGKAESSEGLGARLRQHSTDPKKDWDRFSWFGFRSFGQPDNRGIIQLNENSGDVSSVSSTTISNVEALLINVLGTHRSGNNIKPEYFAQAEHWSQISWADRDWFFEKISGDQPQS